MDKYYIVRTDRAGVFFGQIEKIDGNVINMKNVRKLFYWDGACAVEELAMSGVKKPENCKFTVVVPLMAVFDPIQIIPCTDEATDNLSKVRVWKF